MKSPTLISFYSSPARSLTALAIVVLGLHAQAADFHVSLTGRDSNKGSVDSPFATLAAARDAARKVAGKEQVTVHVADGIHYLPATLVFGPEDSGSKQHPVLWRAENEGKAVISGGKKLQLDWKPWRDGILMATTPAIATRCFCPPESK